MLYESPRCRVVGSFKSGQRFGQADLVDRFAHVAFAEVPFAQLGEFGHSIGIEGLGDGDQAHLAGGTAGAGCGGSQSSADIRQPGGNGIHAELK